MLTERARCCSQQRFACRSHGRHYAEPWAIAQGIRGVKIELRGLKELQDRIKKMQRDIEAETRAINRTRFVMPVAVDERGMVDRECPACESAFKVAETAWDTHSGDVTCPYYGHTAPSDQWTARAHVEAAKRVAHAMVKERFDGIIRGRPAPRTAPTRGIERVVMEQGDRWRVVALPARALALLNQERTCTRCGCCFAFVGAAFFCPLCGDNSADATFDQTSANIRRSVEALDEICRDLDVDLRAQVTRTLLEKHMQDVVTAFQRVGEELYRRHTGTSPPTNAFQRLDGGSDGDSLWTAATGRSYPSHLGATDHTVMVTYFQRRHLLAHCDGIVDAKYLTKTGDTTYAVGQRLRITPADVLRFVAIVERLVSGLRGDVASKP